VETPLEATVLVPALVVGYALVARRQRPSRAQVALFAAGVALILAAFVTPLQRLALHYLLSAHLLQNVVLAEWAPLLLVAAVPRLPTPSNTVLLGTLGVWLATYFLWHLPVAYDAALRRPHSLLLLEHGCYLAAGLLLWWPVVHGRQSAGLKALYLFAAFVLASPLGLLLALLPRAVYSTYAHAPRIRGLSARADQQIAGLTMAAEQAIVLFAGFLLFFTRFLGEEGRAGMLDGLSSSSRR
jgi:cytochrome c oxidase assembly factor CtaG